MLKCLILWEEGDTPEIKALSIGSLVWEDEVVLLREGLQGHGFHSKMPHSVEIGSDLFSTVWRRSAGVLCEGRSDAYGYQYNFLFGQARMKSSSYDIEGKNHGGVYPR